jgi:hypothetical protein
MPWKSVLPSSRFGFCFRAARMAGDALFPRGVLLGGGRCGRGDVDFVRERFGVFEAELQNVVRFAKFDHGEAFGEFFGVSTSGNDAGEIGHDGFALARIGGEGEQQVFFDVVGRAGDGGVHPAEVAVDSRESSEIVFARPEAQSELEGELRLEIGFGVDAGGVVVFAELEDFFVSRTQRWSFAIFPSLRESRCGRDHGR